MRASSLSYADSAHPTIQAKEKPQAVSLGLTVIHPHRLLSTAKIVHFRLQILDMLREL